MSFYPPSSRIAGRYEVASRPLLGGMGIVYLCFDHKEQRPVALKTFKPEFLPDRATRDRFLREGSHWVELGNHPHVVRCYRVFKTEVDDHVFLALELVAKDPHHYDASLRCWLTPGVPMPLEQGLLFALQIARGMQHAVEAIPGFVHRDLKPENVLVGADKLPGNVAVNRLRVTDLGLAAVLEAANSKQQVASEETQTTPFQVDLALSPSGPLARTQLTYGIVGTPLYMAPEQWRGKVVSVATDVYALGCILYEMLTGQHVVAAHSLEALQQAHCEGKHRPLPCGLAADVGDLVARCLAVEPGERYGSWAALENSLAAAYQGVRGQPVPVPIASSTLTHEERVQNGWSYNEIGRSYLDLGKAEVSVDYFQWGMDVGEAEGDRTLVGTILSNLGGAFERLGDARRAIGYYERAMAIGREIGDRIIEGASVDNLGQAWGHLGDTRRAISYHEQALAIAREVNDHRGEAQALMGLGESNLRLGDAQRAIDYHEQALAIALKIMDRRMIGQALCDLGRAWHLLGDVRRAIGYHEQFLQIAGEIGDRRGEGIALEDLALAYADQGDVRCAVSYHEQALAIAREIGNRREEGAVLGNLGIAYKNLGEALRAVNCHEQALAIARETGNRAGEGHSLANLGQAHARLGKAEQAINYYEKALTIHRELGERREEGIVLGNLGNAYLQLRKTRRAIGCHEQSLAIARECKNRRGEGNALGSLGNAYLDLGEAHRAIRFFEQRLVIAAEIGDAMGLATGSVNLAGLYVQQGEAVRALPLAQQAAELFAQIGHAQYAQRAQALVATIRAALR